METCAQSLKLNYGIMVPTNLTFGFNSQIGFREMGSYAHFHYCLIYSCCLLPALVFTKLSYQTMFLEFIRVMYKIFLVYVRHGFKGRVKSCSGDIPKRG